jgi:hypothetical protein
MCKRSKVALRPSSSVSTSAVWEGVHRSSAKKDTPGCAPDLSGTSEVGTVTTQHRWERYTDREAPPRCGELDSTLWRQLRGLSLELRRSTSSTLGSA